MNHNLVYQLFLAIVLWAELSAAASAPQYGRSNSRRHHMEYPKPEPFIPLHFMSKVYGIVDLSNNTERGISLQKFEGYKYYHATQKQARIDIHIIGLKHQVGFTLIHNKRKVWFFRVYDDKIDSVQCYDAPDNLITFSLMGPDPQFKGMEYVDTANEKRVPAAKWEKASTQMFIDTNSGLPILSIFDKVGLEYYSHWRYGTLEPSTLFHAPLSHPSYLPCRKKSETIESVIARSGFSTDLFHAFLNP